MAGRGQLLKARKDHRDRFSDRLVRAEHHSTVKVVVQPDWKPLAELSLGCLMTKAGIESGPQKVELSLADRALQSEHQPVVVVTCVIDPVAVGDERVGHGAKIQQLIPVGIAPCEAADLLAEHQANLAETDSRDE